MLVYYANVIHQHFYCNLLIAVRGSLTATGTLVARAFAATDAAAIKGAFTVAGALATTGVSVTRVIIAASAPIVTGAFTVTHSNTATGALAVMGTLPSRSQEPIRTDMMR